MAAVRRRDTRPELALRHALHGRGLRYFVDRAPLAEDRRRRADLVFPRARVAVFVDGCFWHGCPEHTRLPTANAEWWAAKLEGNVSRDRETDARLAAAGWRVVRVWEHEPVEEAASRVEALVRGLKGHRHTEQDESEHAMNEGRFTLPPFEGARSWPAVRFGEPWNGFATPVVTRETLEDLLKAVGDGYRWEGADVVVWSSIDLGPDDLPEYEERLSPGRDGLYDLSSLGWVFEQAV